MIYYCSQKHYIVIEYIYEKNITKEGKVVSSPEPFYDNVSSRRFLETLIHHNDFKLMHSQNNIHAKNRVKAILRSNDRLTTSLSNGSNGFFGETDEAALA